MRTPGSRHAYCLRDTRKFKLKGGQDAADTEANGDHGDRDQKACGTLMGGTIIVVVMVQLIKACHPEQEK